MRPLLILHILIPALCMSACSPIRFHDLPADGGKNDASALADADLDGGVDDANDNFTVVVSRNGAPAAGLVVVFHDASGHALGTAVSGNDGRATHSLTKDGMVTVVQTGPSGAPKLKTLAGLTPGRALLFDVGDFGRVQTSTVIAARVAARLPSSFPSADHYALDFGCEQRFPITDPTVPAFAALPEKCIGPGSTVTVTGMALTVDEVPIAFTSLVGWQLARTGTTAILFANWKTDFRSIEFDAFNGPADGMLIAATITQRVGRLRFEYTGRAPLTAGAGTTEVRAFSDLPEPDQLTFALAFDPRRPLEATVLFDSSARLSDTIRLDLSTSLLPRILYDGLDVNNPSRPKVVWHSAAHTADGILFGVRWQRSSAPDDFATWVLLVPPETQSPLQIPELPEELNLLRPTSTSTLSTPFIQLADLDISDGYQDLLTTYAQAGFLGAVEYRRFRLSMTGPVTGF